VRQILGYPEKMIINDISTVSASKKIQIGTNTWILQEPVMLFMTNEVILLGKAYIRLPRKNCHEPWLISAHASNRLCMDQ
jgi:hypothetical protein